MDVVSYSAEWVISSVVLAAGVTGMVTLHNLVLDKNHVADRAVDAKQVVSSPLPGDYNKVNGGMRPYELTASEVVSDIQSIARRYQGVDIDIRIESEGFFYDLGATTPSGIERIVKYDDVSFLFDGYKKTDKTDKEAYKNAELQPNNRYMKVYEFEENGADPNKPQPGDYDPDNLLIVQDKYVSAVIYVDQGP